MEKDEARAIFERFLAVRETGGVALAIVPAATRRVSRGWAFVFQSRTYVETGDPLDMLFGHGPTIVLDDGRILESGSLDQDPEEIIRRHDGAA